jgi:hypothetical protein
VRIELPSDGDPAKSEAEQQQNQDNATSDLQKALGGKDESKDGPNDGTKGGGAKSDDKSGTAPSAEDKMAAEVEKALKGGK